MTKFESDSSVKRILKNGFFVTGQFLVYAVSGLLFVPFLVKRYGTGSYGLIALAGFLTQYVGLISGCVGRSIARFLNIALNRNDWRQANEIFSTALVANVGLIIIQTPLFALGVWKLNWLIDFPVEIASDFRILVICNIVVFFVSMLTGVLQTPIQAANRLDIGAKISVLSLAMRLILLFVMIESIGPKLWLIGVVDVGLSVLRASMTYVAYRRLTKLLVFKIQYITSKWVKPVLSMAGWSLVASLGFALFVKTDVWMINRFVSKEMAGVYAALLVWPNFVQQIGKLIERLIGPTLMIDYAAGRKERMRRSVVIGAALLNYFAAVAVGVLYVFAGPILSLWMGEGAKEYTLLFRLMTAYLVLTLGVAATWQIFPAMNKVRFVGLANLVTGILNIALSMALIALGWGAVGVAIGTGVAVLLKSAVVIPWKVCRELNLPAGVFLKNYVGACTVFFFVWILGNGLVHVWHLSPWLSIGSLLLLVVLGTAILYSTKRVIITQLACVLRKLWSTPKEVDQV